MNVNAQLRRIEQDLQQNDRQNALRRLRALLDKHDDNAEVWWLLANASTNVQEVRTALEHTLKLDPSHSLARQTLDALLRQFPGETSAKADLSVFEEMFDEQGIDMQSRRERTPRENAPRQKRNGDWSWLSARNTRPTDTESTSGNGRRRNGSTAPLNPNYTPPDRTAPPRKLPEPVDDKPLPLTGLLLGEGFRDDDASNGQHLPPENGLETLEIDSDSLPWHTDTSAGVDEFDLEHEFSLDDRDAVGNWELDMLLDDVGITGAGFDLDTEFTLDDDDDDFGNVVDDDDEDATLPWERKGMTGKLTAHTPNAAQPDDTFDPILDAPLPEQPRPKTGMLDGAGIDVSWLRDEDMSDMGDMPDDLLDDAPTLPPSLPRSVDRDDVPRQLEPPRPSPKPQVRANTRSLVSREFRDQKRPVHPPDDPRATQVSERQPVADPMFADADPLDEAANNPYALVPHHEQERNLMIEEPPLDEQDSRGFSSRIASLNTQTLDMAHRQLVAMVRVYDQTAEMCRAGTQFWVPLLFESVLTTGDYVRMDETGHATIHVPGSDAIIEMMPRSAVRVLHLAHENPGFAVALALVKGEIRADFADSPLDISRYTISTPFADFVLDSAVLDIRSEASGRILAIALHGSAAMQHAGVRYILQTGQGVVIEPDGRHSGILPAESFEQLMAAVDGVRFRFDSRADVQVNVRRGPTTDNELMGAVDIHSIQKVHGISEDKSWYRILYEGHYRWICARDLGPKTDATILPIVPQAFVENDDKIPNVADERTNLPTALHRLELALLAAISQWRVYKRLQPLQAREPLQIIAERILEESQREDADAPAWTENVTAFLAAAVLRDAGYLDGVEGVRMVPGVFVGKAASEIAMLSHWERLPFFGRLLGEASDLHEVGIAATSLPDGGFTFVLVIGYVKAPMPVLLEPATERVVIGQLEALLPYDALNFQAQIKVQLVTPEKSASKKAWYPLQQWLPAPRVDGVFGVIFSDGKRTHRLAIDPQRDIAWLPCNPAIYREVREG